MNNKKMQRHNVSFIDQSDREGKVELMRGDGRVPLVYEKGW